jgi:hypothetical protein
VLFIALLALSGHVASALELRVEAPPVLAAARARIEAVEVRGFDDVRTLVGLSDPGPSIRVVLATDRSEWARRTTPWTAGLAIDGEFIVLFPTRSPVYPHGSLEDVLRHEIAHVLIARAAGGRPVPRWFHEGLATVAERPWGLRDRTRLVYELAIGPRLTLDDIDRLFEGDRGEQTRAYALANRFVRDLLSDHGNVVARDLLDRTADGVSFDEAFAQVTGRTLRSAEAAFWHRQRHWTTWFPIVTSTTILWLLITMLALYAARRQQQKRAALRRRWAEEEERPNLTEPPESDMDARQS